MNVLGKPLYRTVSKQVLYASLNKQAQFRAECDAKRAIISPVTKSD
jgi:hypothetical protein